ncbi:MAG: hypothetical protein VKJ64_19965 [Leptolyngbyaceae bacterium]|nr:hypothetical protein [Leptolyngbyaceae bacterium]
MVDYKCSPLWWNEKDKVGNIAPEDLPLQADTIERLHKWSKSYDATLNWDDPASSSGFSTDEAGEAFEQEGILLWKQLQEELGTKYEVVYFSDRLHQLLDPETDLPLALSSSH